MHSFSFLPTAQHIETIKTREYVRQRQDQCLIPTPLGIGLVRAYQTLEMDFDKPTLRAQMEADCKQIEVGRKNKSNVVHACLTAMKGRFASLKNKTVEWQRKFDEFVSGQISTISDSATLVQRNFMPCVQCRGNAHLDLMSSSGNNNNAPNKRFLSCKKCKKSYPMPRNGEISILDDKTCPLCGNCVIKVSNIEKRTNYKICPSCYNVPPRQTGNSGSSNMRCLDCRYGACPLASGVQTIVHERCNICKREPLLLKSRSREDGRSYEYRIMCKAKCPNANVSFPDFAVKKVVLPSDMSSRRQCSQCGMQKLLVTLKTGSVPPGTTIEKMRCPRCDELLRNLNGGRGNRNNRKRPSSTGNATGNRNQMSSTSRTTENYSGQPQVRMNYSSSSSTNNRYASRNTDYSDQQRRQKRSRAPRQSSSTTVTCKCGGAGTLRTSNTVRNPNRQFYKCSKCDGFIQWADEL